MRGEVPQVHTVPSKTNGRDTLTADNSTTIPGYRRHGQYTRSTKCPKLHKKNRGENFVTNLKGKISAAK